MGPNPYIIIHNIGILAGIFQSISIIMGIGMFMCGLFGLKRYGETRTMMSHQITLAGPLMMVMGGVMFLILPTVISTVLYAFWSTSSPLPYVGSGKGMDIYIPVILTFVRLLGVASMMRGITLFSRVGNQQGQHGAMHKAVIHMLGGLLCIHILGTVNLLKTFFNMT